MYLVPRGLYPKGLVMAIRILVVGVVGVLGDADIGIAEHGERLFALGLGLQTMRVADEWHWKHWAAPKFGLLDGFGPTPYRILPRSSDAESVYRFCGGVPYLEASYFELNGLISAEASYAPIASVMIV